MMHDRPRPRLRPLRLRRTEELPPLSALDALPPSLVRVPVDESRRPSTGTPTAPYRTQVIPFWLVARFVQCSLWVLCFCSFTISWIGNLSVFGVSLVPALVAPGAFLRASWPALLAALLWQVVLQVGQFYAAAVAGRRSRRYLVLLLASVVPSWWTYLPLLPWRGSLWFLPAMVGLFVALWINDAWQEQVLVDRTRVERRR